MSNKNEIDAYEASFPTQKVEEVSEESLKSESAVQSYSLNKTIDYRYGAFPLIHESFPEGIDPKKLVPAKNIQVLDVPIDLVNVHPAASITWIPKDNKNLKYVMSKVGQLDPISVVVRSDKFLVFDGISRYFSAIELGWEQIRIEVFNYSDSDLEQIHVIKNMKTKRPIMEDLLKAESVLGVLGKSQGKRREMLGDLNLSTEEYGLIGMDRFELTCAILNLGFSSSTLRKIIAVKDFEESGDEEIKGLGLLSKIENNMISVSKATRVMENFIEAREEREKPNPIIESLDAGHENRFRLFNKSSKDLSELETNSISMVMTSQGYFGMRIYPAGVNDDEPLGHENNVDEFVSHSVESYRELKRVLKEDGSLFINIGEAYRNGECTLSVSKLILAMVEDGWHLIQTLKWVKTNAKPQGNLRRLRPVTEEILHFVKDPKSFKFKEFVIWKEGEPITIQSGCNDEITGDKKPKEKKFSLNRPTVTLTDFLDGQKIEGIIQGSIFNWAKLRSVDPDFNHLAPAPDYLAIIPILMTTDIGDTVLDIFCGSGTFIETALKLGRNGVGYDTDPKSIVFSEKRLHKALKDEVSFEELVEVESQYFKNVA
jgi:site-specific DNA-methyltransferase (adenine-specific)